MTSCIAHPVDASKTPAVTWNLRGLSDDELKSDRMTFACQMTFTEGRWVGTHASPGVGPISVTGNTRDEVLSKLEAEIRYWLEMRPCTGERYRNIPIELIQSSP